MERMTDIAAAALPLHDPQLTYSGTYRRREGGER